ncbi:MAG: putative signal transducing protein [Janthinobacterium lividum]
MAEPAASQTPYLKEVETPLETAARADAQADRSGTQARREEQEADRVVADIDAYVAQTDPASLPEAEQALEAWEIPSSPLDGVPADVVFEPNVEGEPLVTIFEAQSEPEANIVRGLLEASGIPVFINSLSGPALGGIFQPDETRWGDILVSAPLAEAARTAIQEATQSAAVTSSPDILI